MAGRTMPEDLREGQTQSDGQQHVRGEAPLRHLVHALAGAADVIDIARLTAEAAVEMTRAYGAYVEKVISDDGEVEVVAAAGDGVPPIGTRAPYPGSLAEEVIARGEPMLLARIDEIGARMVPMLAHRCRDCTGMVAPLVSEDDVLGCLVLLRSKAQARFGEIEKDRARTLGDLAAVALRRVAMLTRERAALHALRVTEREQRILADTGRLLSSALNVQMTLESLAHLLVEELCDWCTLYVPVADGARRAAFAGRDAEAETLVRRVVGETLPASSNALPIQVLRTGKAVLLPEVPERMLEEAAAHSHADARMLREIRPRSSIVVPLIARGQIVGAMALVSTDASRRYGADDLALVEQVASRVALTLDNARLYEESERRAREEMALGRAVATVSAAFTVEEIIQEIARSALVATGATGAFVERVYLERGDLEVVAAAGENVPEVGLRAPFSGSYAEWVIEHGRPEAIADLATTGRPMPKTLPPCERCPAIVVPLIDAGQAIGALFLLRRPGEESFRTDEVERAFTFGTLAALAFRKVDLLETSQKRREELELVMQSRARLMRGFTHDVKNPLGAADGFLQLLEEGIVGPLSDQQLDSVHRARGLIRSALGLINDLLHVERTEAGHIDIRPNPVDVRDSVRELAGEYRAQAEAKGLSLESHVPQDFPITRSDPARIRQILGNLLSNAVKYTNMGGVRLALGLRSGDDAPGPGRWIVVDVSDTGPGIALDVQALLFQEFARLDRGTTGGTGIGLAISQRMARALGGAITLRSEAGKGSTFTLWLPLTES